MDLIEVERIVARDRTVESCLEEGSPPVPEPVGAPLVSLANSRYSAEDRLPAVHVLHGGLAEEEVDMVLVLQTAHKVRRIEVFVVVLLRPQVVLDDQRVRPGEVSHGGREQVVAGVERGGVVPRVVGSVALPAELRLHLVVAGPVQEVMSAQRVVAVGPAHQQAAGRDGGEDPDVVLTVLPALPLQVTGSLVPGTAGPVDSLE